MRLFATCVPFKAVYSSIPAPRVASNRSAVCHRPQKQYRLKVEKTINFQLPNMKRSKFTETQIVKALKEHENGRKAEEISRELSISTATFYKWKERYGGLEASDLKKMKDLEAENSKLKRMFAELSLDHHALKEILSKKNWG